jgi:hypothetical protein
MAVKLPVIRFNPIGVTTNISPPDTDTQTKSNPYLKITVNELTSKLKEVEGQIIKVEDKIKNADPTDKAKLNDQLSELKKTKTQLEEAISFAAKCTRNNQDIGWMRENIEDCKTHLKSEQYEYWLKVISTGYDGTDPCGTATVAKINRALQKLFVILKSIKKYYDKFVQSALNAITDIPNSIQNIIDTIAGAVRILVQRIRNWIIQKIKNGLGDAINSLFPNLAKAAKDGVVKLINDAIFCKFGEIIKGLGKMISDFVMSLIGNLINAPYCAAEQFTNALLNNIANRIDVAIKPIMDQINSIVGGIGKVAGSVFEAIDFILGFEGFLCSNGIECPQVKTVQGEWWGGKQEERTDRFETFLNKLNLSSGESQELLNKFEEWTDTFPIFKGDGNEISPDVEQLGATLSQNCGTGAYRCGPPKIQIFGGGGVGAVADAIVNNVGQVVGINLKSGGEGYTSTPYVAVVDNCGNGNFASAYAVLEDDPDCTPEYDEITLAPKNNCGRTIKEIVIVNTGNGYLSAPDGRDEFGNLIEPDDTFKNSDNTREYVGCLSEIQVLSTGIGYTEQDSITIEPNIPNLEVRVKLTELGQIVQMDILNTACGLTEIPTITINSMTGGGAEFRPIIQFTPKSEYKDVNLIKAEEIIKVVDCVLK